MKNALFILLFALSTPCFAQSDAARSFSILKKEVQGFIDTTKKLTADNGQYNVYRVFLYDFSSANSICFSVSYIQNRNDYFYLSPPYVFMIDSEFVLIKSPKGLMKQLIEEQQIRLVDSLHNYKIEKKLGNFSHREWTEQGLLFWYDGLKDRKRFCVSNHRKGYVSTIGECGYDNFDSVKQSFYRDTIYRAKYRYPNK